MVSSKQGTTISRQADLKENETFHQLYEPMENGGSGSPQSDEGHEEEGSVHLYS